jgi:hypothetical protein
VRTHVRALEIAGEDLPEIVLAIDDVSRQMIQPGPGGVSQVDGEELDDEMVVVHPARLASKAVVLQPDTGVSFTIVLDDTTRHSKMLWEASVAHGTSERFLLKPFMAEVVPFTIILASVAWVSHVVLGLRIIIPQAVLMMHLGSDRALGWPNWSRAKNHASEEAIPTSGASWVACCLPTLERSRVDMEASA